MDPLSKTLRIGRLRIRIGAMLMPREVSNTHERWYWKTKKQRTASQANDTYGDWRDQASLTGGPFE